VPEITLWNKIGFTNPIDYLNPVLIRPGGTQEFWSNYPILPWLELVTFGMVFGNWIKIDARQAFQRGLILGIVFLVAFIPIRIVDGYRNIRPRGGNDWIAIFNVIKYPPSITFTLLTMGINLILLWMLSRIKIETLVFKPLIEFGREPLFFYTAHLFLYAGLGYLLTPHGSSLFVMYSIWILGLLILYPICSKYGNYKRKQDIESLWRFV